MVVGQSVLQKEKQHNDVPCILHKLPDTHGQHFNVRLDLAISPAGLRRCHRGEMTAKETGQHIDNTNSELALRSIREGRDENRSCGEAQQATAQKQHCRCPKLRKDCESGSIGPAVGKS